MPLSPNSLAFLEQLLKLRTTNEPANRSEHDACRELCAKEAARRGLKSKILGPDAAPSILVGARPESKTPAVLLTAHLDVVPAARPEQYEMKVAGGKLIARGASDMKFAAPLYFAVLEALEPHLRARVLVAFTFDEEVGGSQGTKWLIDEHGLRPQVCFLPDGGDNFQIESDEKGVLQFRVRTTGKSAHGSRPWLGENAIDKLLAVYADLRKAFPVVEKPEWVCTLNFGKMTAGTAANAVPEAAEALLDIRFTEEYKLAHMIGRVEGIVAGRAEATPLVAGDNFHLDRQSKFCAWLQEAARKHRNGQELPYYRSEGASDARYMAKYDIPVVMTKPTCAGHHSADEWMDLASLEPYTAMLMDFVRKAASA